MHVPKPRGIKDLIKERIRFHEKQIEVRTMEIKTMEDAKLQDPHHIEYIETKKKELEEMIQYHKERLQIWKKQLKKFTE